MSLPTGLTHEGSDFSQTVHPSRQFKLMIKKVTSWMHWQQRLWGVWLCPNLKIKRSTLSWLIESSEGKSECGNAGLTQRYTTWPPPLELSLLDSSNHNDSNPAWEDRVLDQRVDVDFEPVGERCRGRNHERNSSRWV